MSDKITEQQVRHVAKLARLKITDEQVKTFTPQLNAILTYIAQLEQLDTSNVEPLAHCLPVSNVLRDDTATLGTGCFVRRVGVDDAQTIEVKRGLRRVGRNDMVGVFAIRSIAAERAADQAGELGADRVPAVRYNTLRAARTLPFRTWHRCNRRLRAHCNSRSHRPGPAGRHRR